MNDLNNHKALTLVNEDSNDTQTINKLFASDLLSHVIGYAEEHDVLITVLNNINVLGVASLLDLSAVIFTHNAKIKPDIITRANDLNLSLFITPLSTADIIKQLASLE
ncbi:MAG: DRTGG domain-containing protein [Candidatus Izemoplasma sp.]|nr:DRTGG domain-containing protein [Candidatus Izemoplasma sp.]